MPDCLRKIRKLILISCFLYAPFCLDAQNNDEVNNQVWLDAYVLHNFNQHFRINPNISARSFVNNQPWKQIFFNPALIYTMNDFIHFHGSIILQYTDEPDKKIFEIRPWQGVMVFFPRIKGFFIQHYLRIEERFFFQNDTEGSIYASRLRYSIQAFIPVNNHNIIDHTFYVWPGIELFMDIAGQNVERYLNRSRYQLGLGYRFSKNYRMELCYMQQYSRSDNGTQFRTSDRILRIVSRFTIL